SIDGAYTSVYHYDAATSTWLLYDATVVNEQPAFAPLVNELTNLETNKGYWLYATEAITGYLGVAGANGLDVANQQFPPATYYGYVLPQEDFQPTAGMSISAWVNGVNCGQGKVELLDGQLAYTVQIESEDSSGRCGALGKAITFQIGEWTMAQQPSWDNAQAQFLTLTSAAVTQSLYLPFIVRP
ncbi:MAG: hypothetical protein KDE51_18485, partial [Anaerolineales bacterium]|nr:hypothetical protein [Anaerolineales bacterium]